MSTSSKSSDSAYNTINSDSELSTDHTLDSEAVPEEIALQDSNMPVPQGFASPVALVNRNDPVGQQGHHLWPHLIYAPNAAAQVLAAANQDQRLTPQQHINDPAFINPLTQKPLQAELVLLVEYVETLLSTFPSPNTCNCSNIKSKLSAYIKQILVGCLATAIHGVCFGFTAKRPHNLSLQVCGGEAHQHGVGSFKNTHWATCVQPVIDYIWNWVVPYHPMAAMYVTCPDVLKYNIEAFIKNVKKYGRTSVIHSNQGRCGYPLWSRDLLADQAYLNTLTPSNNEICSGHMLEYAILIDQIIDFRNNVITPHSGQHYVPAGVNVAQMFDATHKFRS